MKKIRRKKKISIVIPTFNESKNAPLLVRELISNIPKKYDYEIIFVDDNSPDNTYGEIFKIARKNKKIKGLCMYKRAGLQSSIMAGVKSAKGDAVINMDADFQHPPSLLPKLISLWEKDHDLILPVKKEDKSSGKVITKLRHIGYKIWENLSDGVLIPGTSEFRLMDRKVVNYLLENQESEIFIRGLVNLASRNPVFIPYKVGKRKYGKSSFSIKRLLGVFSNGIVSYSIKPLRLAAVFGLLVAFSTFIFLSIDILSSIFSGKRILAGWLTLVLLMLILNSFIIFYLGIIGEYLGVIFKETKKRHKYMVGKSVNL